jgi:hypothetical protein
LLAAHIISTTLLLAVSLGATRVFYRRITMLRTLRWIVVFGGVVFSSVMVSTARSAEPKFSSPRLLNVTPMRVPEMATKYRLMPADHELQNDNAAVILLRMVYEESIYMESVAPKYLELMKLPFDDPSIAGEISFDHFYEQQRRAAYCSHAQWEYPMRQQPLAAILLPDVQSGRVFAARGLALWIRTKMAAKDFDSAREGILVGLAVARHYARSPFLVCQLVSLNIANSMADEIERLASQADAPNLYWALATLPRPFFKLQPSYQWESLMLTRSVPGFARKLPARGDVAAWKKLSNQFEESPIIQNIAENPDQHFPLSAKSVRLMRDEWPRLTGERPDEVAKMSDDEISIRTLLRFSQIHSARIESATALEPPQAVRFLAIIEKDLAEWSERYAIKIDTVLGYNPTSIYARLKSIDRRFAALATIEAVRDYASRHKGNLPDRLDQLVDTRAFMDPISGRLFQYKTKGNSFTLQAPELEELQKVANSLKVKVNINPVYEVIVERVK